MENDVCQLYQDEIGTWWTECGEGFEIMNGAPTQNGFKYCVYCGKELREVSNEK